MTGLDKDATIPASVEAMYADDHAPTAPLADFLAAYSQDDNWWWRISCGSHQNLFDSAVDALEAAVAERDRLQREARNL